KTNGPKRTGAPSRPATAGTGRGAPGLCDTIVLNVQSTLNVSHMGHIERELIYTVLTIPVANCKCLLSVCVCVCVCVCVRERERETERECERVCVRIYTHRWIQG